MHYAKIDKSERLQRVNLFLQSEWPHWRTTRQIIRYANVCAVNSIMSELDKNGIKYDCVRQGNKYYYRLKLFAQS